MIALREGVLLALVAALPAAIAVGFHPELADRVRAGLPADAVRAAEMAAWSVPVLWVDIREAEAIARGHIPGAIAFDESAFSESLGGIVAVWEPGQAIVVYCDSTACARSREVAQRLREAGFTDVYYLHGGWEAWSATHATP